MKRFKLWLLSLGYWIVGSLDEENIPSSGLNYLRAANAIAAQTTAGKKAYFHFLCERLSKQELETLKGIVHVSIRKYPKLTKVGEPN